MTLSSPALVLASRSPRRQELLRQLGLRFTVMAADVDERRAPGQSPADYAVATALAKARAGACVASADAVVLGADTDVVIDGDILGKPRDREDALAMLARLSARTHEVYSAVALVQGTRSATRLSVTRVKFAKIFSADAQTYWDSGEPVGKAGAYAIQGLGARFVQEIHGSYSGVVGLPLFETCELLREFGVEFNSPRQKRAGSVQNPQADLA